MVLWGHLILWGEVSSFRSFPWQASILLHYWPPSLSCVLVGVFGCLAVGCGFSGVWNQLHSNSSSAALMPHRLPTPSSSSASCCRRSFIWTTPFAGRPAGYPAQEKGLSTACSLRLTLQPLPSAAPSGRSACHWQGGWCRHPSQSCSPCSQMFSHHAASRVKSDALLPDVGASRLPVTTRATETALHAMFPHAEPNKQLCQSSSALLSAR